MQKATGFAVGLCPLVGTVVTEVEAVEILYGVRAEHVASGGIGPGTGAVTLLLVGDAAKVEQAFAALSTLSRDEPPPQVG